MKYQTCGGDNVAHESRVLYYTHDGWTHAAGSVTGYFCQQCGTMVPEEHRQLTETERAERRTALRNLMGLNKHREGGPVDGLAFQLEQRENWD